MAKYDKLPRKKKKAVKKTAAKQGKKITNKEAISLANKEAQKQKRNAATLRRYNANKEYLKSLGIPTNIISKSTSIKETKKRAEKYLNEKQKTERNNARKIRQEKLYETKVNRLIEAGFSPEEARKEVGSVWRQKSDKKLSEIIAEKAPPSGTNFTFTAKEYLYIGAAETRGGFRPENYSHLSNGELAAQILDRQNEAMNNPDDSSSMYCVYRVDYDESKKALKRVAKTFYKRGYNLGTAFEENDHSRSHRHIKLDSKQYHKLTISNRWDEHDFYSMVLNCVNQMKNEDVQPFLTEMTRYCNRNGLPFMKNLYKY